MHNMLIYSIVITFDMYVLRTYVEVHMSIFCWFTDNVL